MDIAIDNLANKITNAVREYTQDVTKGIEREIDQTSKQLTKDISSNSPKDSGDYAKGWTRKKMSSGGTIRYVIYNKKKGSISHLLEFGHAKRSGGRISGKPHIRPSYDQEVPNMENRIKAIIRNGG
ncbi:HK97 gp10 family phage protein [Paenibacillus glucanolyticus]|uniref:HK97 gp10 family phage protein n=1 Tax=Paenibacillus glucanolyticus TaxID=59843 RepID=UPI00096CA338|nr:HK97 gp10 family phage protein [Paenibacillus glucanolyticus]OMF70509.1 hypothetical protein BK142_23840 [Paenibacillus glucanolyticus]